MSFRTTSMFATYGGIIFSAGVAYWVATLIYSVMGNRENTFYISNIIKVKSLIIGKKLIDFIIRGIHDPKSIKHK